MCVKEIPPSYEIATVIGSAVIGNKPDYLKTEAEFGLKRKEFSGPFLTY